MANLVTNPGFETGNLTGWTIYTGDGSFGHGSPLASALADYSGIYGLKHEVSTNATSGDIGTNQAVSGLLADHQYDIRCDIQATSSVDDTLRLQYDYVDASGSHTLSLQPTGLNAWERLSTTFITSGAYTSGTVKLYGNGDMYADNIVIEYIGGEGSQMFPVQSGIWVALDSGSLIVGSLRVPVYDDAPVNTGVYPYITISDFTEIPWDTCNTTGNETTCTMHVYSRVAGSYECKSIISEIQSRLHRQNIAIGTTDTFGTQVEYKQVVRDPADVAVTHGIVRVRITTKDN